ncbi:uncharacterized protein LODBEIA_P49430 [Lodderomyces beijingensis]|uniref:DNA damage checkpoint control protein RAD17 n=1 Tax=Lodderomyces beijingensis TaxID=1775926 RepID=A0ABP0ZRF6_9ASCO
MSLFVSSDDEAPDDIHRAHSIPSRQRLLSRTSMTTASSSTTSRKSITFTASTTQIQHLCETLQSLLSINNQTIITIKSTGLALYSTYNYITNVHVNIDPSLFNIYNISSRRDNDPTQEDESEESQLRLGVDINLIADCFASVMSTLKFESAVTCYLTYHGDGHPLIIEFEDSYISEKLEFYTFYVDEADIETSEYSLSIDHEKIIMEVMVKSDVLTNLLQDLNQIGTEILFIYCAENVLNFISSGPIGVSKLIFPNEKTILEKLYLGNNHQHVISQFNFDDFYRIFKAVKLSSKCKIVKDSNGCFSIQLICKNHQQNSYVGTLLTINMTEMLHDDEMVESILQDEQIQAEPAEPTKPVRPREKSPQALSRSVIPDLTIKANEPLFNSFKRARPSDAAARARSPTRGNEDAPSKRNRQESTRRSNRPEGLPLFL